MQHWINRLSNGDKAQEKHKAYELACDFALARNNYEMATRFIKIGKRNLPDYLKPLFLEKELLAKIQNASRSSTNSNSRGWFRYVISLRKILTVHSKEPISISRECYQNNCFSN